MLHLPDILADLDHPQIFPMEFPVGKAQMQQILVLLLQIQLQFPQTRRTSHLKTGFWRSREDPGSILERQKEGSAGDEQEKWGIYGILAVFEWSQSGGGEKVT